MGGSKLQTRFSFSYGVALHVFEQKTDWNEHAETNNSISHTQDYKHPKELLGAMYTFILNAHLRLTGMDTNIIGSDVDS